MKRASNLWNEIISYENILLAHMNASRGKNHYQEVQRINSDVDFYIKEIQTMLINKTYHTSTYTVFTKKDKNKLREIYKLPYYPDRIVHWAIMQILEPVFTKLFISQSCASISHKGIHKALEYESKYLKDKNNTQYCLKLDVRKFFPSINQDILSQLVKKRIKDKDLLYLLDDIIYSTDSGVPIGNYLSQYFANFYLTEFDHYVKETLRIKYYVRYMDDIVILGKTKEELFSIFHKVESYLKNALKLEVKSNWQIFSVEKRGIDFVGYRHFRKFILLRKSTCQKFKRKSLRIAKKDALDSHDFCVLNSYLGWLVYCNSHRLVDKYVLPLKDKLYAYEKSQRIKKHCAKRFYRKAGDLVYEGV